MLADIKRDCIEQASKLGNYQQIDITTLMNKYCETTDLMDDTLRGSYLAAIILRFWYTIDKMYKKSQNVGLEREDFFTWLVEAIEYACKYRAWQNPEKNTNAQACINQCLETIRLQKYYDFNLAKHKINYNLASLDAAIDDSDDGKTTVIDTLVAEDTNSVCESESAAHAFIQQYIDRHKVVEAIILDTIASNDVQKHSFKTIKTVNQDNEPYKYVETSSEFWPYKLVQLLNALPENYTRYFSRKYQVADKPLEVAVRTVQKANNQKLYRYLRSTLKDAKQFASALQN